MKLKSVIQAIRKREFGYYASKRIFQYFERRKPDLQPFASDYMFDNRKRDSDNLLIVLLGFQPFYWDAVLNRVKRNAEEFKEGVDVCLCVPCGANADAWGGARRFAENYGFSFLRIKDDLLAQAQNTAILLHPNAKWIFKIDEDIILPDNYLTDMKRSYVDAEDRMIYKIGFLTPLLNLNGVCTHHFLKAISIEKDYEQEFGTYKVNSINNAPIHLSSAVAKFIWKHSIPFDVVAKKVKESKGEDYMLAPVRYSIGAILCTRNFWEEIGYFKLSVIGRGAEEEIQMNTYCQTNMLGIVVAKKILAGHLGFYRQKEACRLFFEEHINEIKHN